jgi:hypothetical protein
MGRMMQKTLILIGAAILFAGLAWPWLSQMPFGRLPGDFRFEVGGAKVFFPIATCIVVSVVLTLLLRIGR